MKGSQGGMGSMGGKGGMSGMGGMGGMGGGMSQGMPNLPGPQMAQMPSGAPNMPQYNASPEGMKNGPPRPGALPQGAAPMPNMMAQMQMPQMPQMPQGAPMMGGRAGIKGGR